MGILDDEAVNIEAQYLRSPFIQEICVIESGERDGGLHAVVVPNLTLLRNKRIANVGDLVRFEMEGQSIHLPPEKRVRAYDISFESLPRTESGELDRATIHQRVRDKKAEPASLPAFVAINQSTAVVIDAIAERTKVARLAPNSNLEIDLGLDSIDRVELFAELEQRCGVKVPQQQAHDILTVSQLIDAFEAAADRGNGVTCEDVWRFLLEEAHAAGTPDVDLTWVLKNGGAGVAALWTTLRLLRLLMPRISVVRGEHVPAKGPYILCPNHQSYLDPFFICSVLPYRLVRQMFAVGAAEYFETPLTTWLARQCKLVPVDPDANLVAAMRVAAHGLKHHKVLLVFPEGERSIDGLVKRFKKGAVVLSRQLDIPVVPVAIRGAFEVWPRNRPFNWRAIAPSTEHHIRIAFGAPMRFPASATSAEASAMLQQRVGEMWVELGGLPEPRRQAHQARDAADEQNAKFCAPRHEEQPRRR